MSTSSSKSGPSVEVRSIKLSPKCELAYCVGAGLKVSLNILCPQLDDSIGVAALEAGIYAATNAGQIQPGLVLNGFELTRVVSDSFHYVVQNTPVKFTDICLKNIKDNAVDYALKRVMATQLADKMANERKILLPFVARSKYKPSVFRRAANHSPYEAPEFISVPPQSTSYSPLYVPPTSSTSASSSSSSLLESPAPPPPVLQLELDTNLCMLADASKLVQEQEREKKLPPSSSLLLPVPPVSQTKIVNVKMQTPPLSAQSAAPPRSQTKSFDGKGVKNRAFKPRAQVPAKKQCKYSLIFLYNNNNSQWSNCLLSARLSQSVAINLPILQHEVLDGADLAGSCGGGCCY